MRTALLHLDGALDGQTVLGRRVAEAGGVALDLKDLGPSLRLWARPPAVERLQGRLDAGLPKGPLMAFTGSGDFHHVTALLLARACRGESAGAISVLHFDNHPDWVRFDHGLHCGSWAAWAALNPTVARLITIGPCSRDVRLPHARQADPRLADAGKLEVYAYRPPVGRIPAFAAGWPTIAELGEPAFLDLLPDRIGASQVYVTIDKDVLRADDAVTNWDQGRLSLDYLMALVRAACAGRRLIGVDVTGDWSAAAYGGDGLAPLLKRGEAWLDQPRTRPAPEALAVNERANLRLLDLFEELAA